LISRAETKKERGRKLRKHKKKRRVTQRHRDTKDTEMDRQRETQTISSMSDSNFRHAVTFANGAGEEHAVESQDFGRDRS
jgi:hypothetical protein